jgi:hypothetical protein
MERDEHARASPLPRLAFTNQLVRAKYRFPDEPLEGDGKTQKLAMKTGGGHGKRYHGGLN